MQKHIWQIHLQSVIFGQIPTPVTWVSNAEHPDSDHPEFTSRNIYIYVKTQSIMICFRSGSAWFLHQPSSSELAGSGLQGWQLFWSMMALPQRGVVITFICRGLLLFGMCTAVHTKWAEEGRKEIKLFFLGWRSWLSREAAWQSLRRRRTKRFHKFLISTLRLPPFHILYRVNEKFKSSRFLEMCSLIYVDLLNVPKCANSFIHSPNVNCRRHGPMFKFHYGDPYLWRLS